MSGPTRDEAAAVRADSDMFPWVQDFEDIWHLRPRGRGWSKAGEREDDAQAETLCGEWVASTHVSNTAPNYDEVCGQCRGEHRV